MKLGVNIDHIAVLREARGVNDPDILEALPVLRRSGADQITIHLREDRRHIRDIDAKRVCELAHLPVNIECAVEAEMLNIMATLKPHRVTLVPEKREERTTEGGLDVEGNFTRIKEAVAFLQGCGIVTSVFIEPTPEAVEFSAKIRAEAVEFHTGKYANLYAHAYEGLAKTPYAVEHLPKQPKECEPLLRHELMMISRSALMAKELGLEVAAGHGLNYANIAPICEITTIEELNIGQSIIARSVFTGLETAIKEMKRLISA